MMPNYMLAKNTIGKTVFTRDPNPVVVDAYYQSTPQPAAQTNGTTTRPPPPVPQPNFRVPNLQDQFLKGIKRDPSLFPTLKDEKFHDSWHRSFENQMHAQGLHQVIDTTYIASTPDEQAVFNLMQTFTYAVLESKVLTTKGKEIVCQHELTRDARATYSALLKHHRNSTASTIAARDIMAFLTTSTIGDGRVKGTTSDFISYWCDQARLYQQLLGDHSSLSDNEKMIHLVRAVATIPELRSIKATADMLSMTTGANVSFAQYYQLLVSAAAQYDATSKTTPKRMVYQHDLIEDDDVEFDIDTPIDMFYAHAAASHKRPSSPSAGKRVFMTREQWSQLDDDTKKIWSTIPEKFKAIILGKSMDHSTTRRQSNVHKLQPKPKPDPIFEDDTHTESSTTDTITAHKTQQTTIPAKYPPHDIHSILS